MKLKIFTAPQKYVQGPNALETLGKWAKKLGKRIFVITDDFVRSLVESKINNSAKKEKIAITINHFNGESSMAEIKRLVKLTKAKDVIVGIGGGKTLDSAKAVAFLTKNPVIVCPTLASTDAPTSALAIIYTPDGQFQKYMHLPFNPNIVLVDTAIIIKAPPRFLAAGIGDALATFYEAKVCVESGAINMAGGISTRAAFALAKLCAEILYQHGIEGYKACKKQKLNKAFEATVEANTLLSGLGFESSGLAAAHSIHDGLTALEETHHFMHGEKVAFGLVAQMVFDKNWDQLEKVVKFLGQVKLPVTLKELHITEDVEKKIKIVAEKAVAENETIHSYPFKVKAKKVYQAIMLADSLATKIKEGKKWRKF